MDRLLYRPQEVAGLLGISRARVYHLIQTGDLPAVRIGGTIRVPADSLRNWIEAKKEDPTGFLPVRPDVRA
jgi:excisionase family DNA binding protein